MEYPNERSAERHRPLCRPSFDMSGFTDYYRIITVVATRASALHEMTVVDLQVKAVDPPKLVSNMLFDHVLDQLNTTKVASTALYS